MMSIGVGVNGFDVSVESSTCAGVVYVAANERFFNPCTLVLVNAVWVESLLAGVFGNISSPAIGVFVRVLVCGIWAELPC